MEFFTTIHKSRLLYVTLFLSQRDLTQAFLRNFLKLIVGTRNFFVFYQLLQQF